MQRGTEAKRLNCERDMIVVRRVRADATARDLHLLMIDSSLALHQVFALVESHFAPFLNLRHD